VGTSLVTSYDHAALDGVYKLSALRDEKGEWEYKLKLSEQAVKVSNPGIYQVRRFFSGEQPVMDVLYDLELGISNEPEMQLLDESNQTMALPRADQFVDLLQPIFQRGKLVYASESIHVMRDRTIQQVTPFVRAYPVASYPVGLEKNLSTLKQQLMDVLSEKNVSKKK
jgi:nicotinate phosphoribosyltransferase